MSSPPHEYRTIISNSIGEHKDRGSRFIAHLMPLRTEEMAKEFLDQLRREHPKAHHICYALRLGFDGAIQKINDDGEPSGTAGKPILNQLLAAQLTFAFAAVVRYFGGIKLGTSGLIQAYKQSTQYAIEAAQIAQKQVFKIVEVQCDYALLGDVFSFATRQGLKLNKIVYNDPVKIVLPLPVHEADQVIKDLTAYVYLQHRYEVTTDQLNATFSHFE